MSKKRGKTRQMVWVERVVRHPDFFVCHTRTREENPDKDGATGFYVEKGAPISEMTRGPLVVERTINKSPYKLSYLWRIIVNDKEEKQK